MPFASISDLPDRIKNRFKSTASRQAFRSADVAIVALTKDAWALVDKEDELRVCAHGWCLHTGGYGVATVDNQNTLLHRFIMQAAEDQYVDHINGERLDNRKANLRLCDNAESNWNKPIIRKGGSRYRGVSWHKRAEKWITQTNHRGEYHYMGLHRYETIAALAYDCYVRARRAQYAVTNFTTLWSWIDAIPICTRITRPN